MPGLRVGVTCLSPSAAADAVYSVSPRAAFLSSGGLPGEISYDACPDSPSGWCRVLRVGDSVTVVKSPFPSLPECEMYEGFFDGIQFGWLVLSVLVAVAAFRMMQQGAK